MSLTPGQTLLQYRLVEPIGEGGMGVVWRAQDTSLGREAALKFLPDLLVADPERLARLEREARLLAALNHPHIASIHGFHQAEGARFLAMELVEGEDLARRLARGAVPVSEALPLALQIAEALEHAHEKGVIHRDLKPANVKLDAGGSAKVLDFGLAKAIEGDPATARSGSALSHSPTITGGMTAANVLLGTAAYMSPEQARGQVADRRADIWAFGVVLMEMLTGRRLFEGETISDTLAAVLRSEPEFAALPADTPPRVRRLLRRCLERDPKRRLRDIGEARIALEETLRGVPDESAPAAAAAPARGLPWLPVGAALAIGAILAFVAARATVPPRAEAPLRKFSLEADTSGAPYQSPVISPDGRFVAGFAAGRLVLRDLSRFDSRSFPAETGAQALCWSPDSRHLAYAAGSRLIRVSAADGSSQVLSDTREAFTGGSGTCWTSRGTILFSRGDSLGVLEVSERGGDPKVVVPVVPGAEGDLHEPAELPGGRGIVFIVHAGGRGLSQIGLWSGGKRKILLEHKDQSLGFPRYDPAGYLIYHRSPTTPGLWAVPFSLAKLEVTGEPFLVAADGNFPSVSSDGTLCYRPGGGAGATELVWLSVEKRAAEPIGLPRERGGFVLAADPTGPRAIRSEAEGINQDLWMYDYSRGTRTRLTFHAADEEAGGISPDGRTLVYQSHLPNCPSADCYVIVRRALDGSGPSDTLARAGVLPTWAPDGKNVFYVGLGPDFSIWSVMRVPADGSGPPAVVIPGNRRALMARLSPDGSLLAYVSLETERYEVFLTRYPSLEGRWQVSTQGGQWPQWSPKGDRLYFSHGEEILAVDVSGGGAPTLGTPRTIATRPAVGGFPFGFDMGFVMSPDGTRLLTARSPDTRRHAPSLAVVQNWAAEFRGERK